MALTMTGQSTEESGVQIKPEGITEIRSDRPDESEARLHFSLSGPGMEGVLQAGDWRIDRMEDDTGASLIPPLPAQDNDAEDGDSGGSFRPLRKSMNPSGDRALAANSAMVSLPFLAPTRAARKITVVEGSLGLVRFRRQVVLIPDLRGGVERSITDPLFDAHGITVRIVDPGHAFPGFSTASDRESLTARAVALRIEGEIDKVGEFFLQRPDGSPIESREAGFGAGRSRVIGRMATAESLPDAVVGCLTLPIDPTTIRVRFSFRDILLP